MNFYSSIYSFSFLFGVASTSIALMLQGLEIPVQQNLPINRIVNPQPDVKIKRHINQTFDSSAHENPETKDEIFVPNKEPETPNLLQRVIRSQLNDFRDFDLSKAYYANTSSDFQKAFDVDFFKAYVRKNPILFRNKSFNIDNTTFHDVLGVVTGKLIGSDGQEARVQYDLIQENGNWKIRSINLKYVIQPMQQKVKMTWPQQR